MMWPFTRKPQPPKVTAPEDIAILNCMTNCTIKGKMVLPSGFTIPPPPAGKVWHVNKGVITEKEDKS